MFPVRLPVHVGLCAVAFSSAVSLATPPREPVNLSLAKAAIIAYHDKGTWAAQTARIDASATIWVGRRSQQVKHPALVLDIDDTSLSTWNEEKATDFGYVPADWSRWEQTASAPAIPATLKLFRFAKAHGVAVFFVTGRREGSRAWTVKNLVQQGYVGYAHLYLRPLDDHANSVIPFKSGCRKEISHLGYRIIANVGDQLSDLKGGFSERWFKLPNPMYKID